MKKQLLTLALAAALALSSPAASAVWASESMEVQESGAESQETEGRNR